MQARTRTHEVELDATLLGRFHQAIVHVETRTLGGEGTSFQILGKGIISTDGDMNASPNGRVVIEKGLVHHCGNKARIIKIALKDLLA